ncbi:hypothetical protein BGZ72_002404 [Mortierella alpina]|nr:hypothetical protein BGZ72_002404 [Mortierella alpina]
MSCPAGYTFDTKPRVAPFAATTETHKPGQRIKRWDNDIIWTENHLPASKLDSLRSLGDPLADDALAALEIKPGDNAFEALLAYTSQPSHKQKSPAPQQLLTQVMTVPEWVDWDSLQRGQQVYWRYCLFINNAFLHYCVVNGFSMSKTVKVLKSTGYLVGQRSKQRFFETAQFVFDVVHSLDYLRPGSGIAWKSIVRVRLLHSGVRLRLLKISRAHSKHYNVKENGIPINQEDLLGVLFTCSNTMWQVMERRMDVRMTTQERKDFMHLWRYVGYMMGVDDTLGATQTPERADACLDSIMLHLADPDLESGRLCSTLLRNMASPPRLFFRITKAIGLLDRYKLHMALAEHLFGTELWKLNGLPSVSRPYRIIKELMHYSLYVDLWLVTKSPRWFHFRTSLIRKYQGRAIAKKLGGKRTQFELKEVVKERGGGPVDIAMDEMTSVDCGQRF